MAKYFDQNFQTTRIIDKIKDWQDYRQQCLATYTNGMKRIRTASQLNHVDWNTFNLNDYIFTHNTIVASVCHDKNDSHTITEGSVPTINANQNAWLNEVLGPPTNVYKTFNGAENFYEHVQDFRLSKGKVLDAVLRKVKNNAEEEVWYCDILVATNRRHRDLATRISNGELQTLSMGCGLAGTKINLGDNTFKNIEDIEVGDLVLTHKGRIRPVTSLYKHEVRATPLFSIDYVSGQQPLRLTGEHPVFIATKESVNCSYGSRPCKLDKKQAQCFHSKLLPWKCAGEKKPCGREKDTYKYDMKFVPISELKVGDYVAKTIIDEEIENDYFSEDICRLFGLYVGDGYIGWKWDRKTKTKISPTYVEFCFSNKEKELHEEVKEIANKLFSNDRIVIKEVPERSGTYIKIKDESFAKLFLEHAGEGSWNKVLSETIMTLPKEKQKIIISGMMDSDGCYYAKTKQLSYTTASKSLFNQLHMLLLRLRIENFQSTCQRRPSGFKKGNELYDQYMIQISAGSSWKVKCNKNKNYGEEPENSNQLCMFYKEYYLCKIKSINEISINSTVYNFSVEEDESYCVDNLAVHNCLANITCCSKCGKVMRNDWEACNHIRYEIGQPYITPYGYQSKVTELVGVPGNPESCRFIEASWVETPAFEGAVVNHYVNIPDIKSLAAKKIIDIKEAASQIQSLNLNDVSTLNKIRVADKHSMIAIKLLASELSKSQRESRIKNIGNTLEKL